MLDDGVFNISHNSNHDVNNDVESNDSQANLKDDVDYDDGQIVYIFMYFISKCIIIIKYIFEF